MRRVAAAVGLLTLLLGACGSPSSNTQARDTLVNAASATRDAGSARMSMEMQSSFSGEGAPSQSVTMHAEGISGFGLPIRGHLTMSFSGSDEIESVLGDGIEMIMLGDALYVRAPFLSSTLPGDEPWVKQDISELKNSQVAQADPTQTLAYLEGVSDEVDEVGSAEVRGVTTTRYDAVVDFEKALENMPESYREQTELFAERFPDTFPMSVWIDSRGLLRRIQSDIEVSGGDEGLSMRMAMTVDLYDFGVKLDIKPPPADQVQEAPASLFPFFGS